MDPVSCRMHLESLLTIGLYIRQDAFQLWLRFLFRPVLFLYLYNVTPQTFALIQKTLGCRPFFTENEHTGSFSGRSEPQNDTGNAPPSQPCYSIGARRCFIVRDSSTSLRFARNDTEVERLRSAVYNYALCIMH